MKLDFYDDFIDNIMYWAGSSVGERLLDTQKVVGSIPIPPTSEIKPSGSALVSGGLFGAQLVSGTFML